MHLTPSFIGRIHRNIATTFDVQKTVMTVRARVRVIRHLYSAILWDEPIAKDSQIRRMIARGITQFYLLPSHEPYIPALTPQPQGITVSLMVLKV